jgi:transposase
LTNTDNEEQARKDEADRRAIVASLTEKLKAGEKSLVGNKGYRRYLKSAGSEHFTLDEAKIAEDRRFDGMWVLRTNTQLPAAEVALKYKQLWMVESIFRSAKSLLETRPIYHRVDDTIRGHVFCSFLALVLRKELEARLEARGRKLEWADIKRDLRALQEVELESEGKRWYLRTDVRGVAHHVLQAAGVAVPPTVRN